MTPEGRVKANVKKILKKYKRVWYFMPVSGGMGEHGIPDFICCVNGKFFAIECKATGASDVTVLQKLQHSRIHASGGICVVIHEGNLALVESYINMMFGQ